MANTFDWMVFSRMTETGSPLASKISYKVILGQYMSAFFPTILSDVHNSIYSFEYCAYFVPLDFSKNFRDAEKPSGDVEHLGPLLVPVKTLQ